MIDEIATYLENRRILITGASGYIASNLIQSLKDIDCTIVRLSRNERLPDIHAKARVVDIFSDLAVSKIDAEILEEVDVIYHFVAQTSVYVAAEDPVADWQRNVLPMVNLLEACRKSGRKPSILFSGTVTESGLPQRLPVDETHEDNPVTIYDVHKLMAEDYLKCYIRQGFVSGAILRLANVYGPGPKSSSSDRAVINVMMQKALAGKPLTVYGKGDCLRDYIFIADVVSAFLMAAAYIDKLNGNHFILGSGEGHTIKEAFELVADRVAARTGNRVPVDHIAPPGNLSAIEYRNFVADTSRFASLTNWKSLYGLKEGIDKTLDTMDGVAG